MVDGRTFFCNWLRKEKRLFGRFNSGNWHGENKTAGESVINIYRRHNGSNNELTDYVSGPKRLVGKRGQIIRLTACQK